MATEPTKENKVLNFSDYYDPDPETTSLMNSREWKDMCRDIDRVAMIKANCVKVPNLDAARNLAVIMRNLKEIARDSELPISIDARYTKDGDTALINFVGLGIDVTGDSKAKFIDAIQAANTVSISNSFQPDKCTVCFSVRNLHKYFKK